MSSTLPSLPLANPLALSDLLLVCQGVDDKQLQLQALVLYLKDQLSSGTGLTDLERTQLSQVIAMAHKKNHDDKLGACTPCEVTACEIREHLDNLEAHATGYLFGIGAPLPPLGTDGDVYEDKTTNERYLKVAGAWVRQGSALIAILQESESLPPLFDNQRGIAAVPIGEGFDLVIADGVPD